jgi:pyridoxamine 5'-phosphate oxidase
MMNIADIRREYARHALDEAIVLPEPIEQFKLWLNEAVKSEILEPTVMHVATVGADGMPSCRVVLLKGVDSGFVFYTNYNSRKGKEILANSKIALTFFWAELERQVCITGNAEKVSGEESDDYFRSRPVGSQIGAHASPQSQKIESRSFLENKLAEYERAFVGTLPVRPEHWGGFRVVPQTVEFWQGRPNRLHDRVFYEKISANEWQISRLAP